MTEARTPRFSEARQLRVFPTVVWRAELLEAMRLRINASILGALDGLGRPLGMKPGQGWQSKQDLHKVEAFAELMACVHDATSELLSFLKIGHEGFAVTACWANILAPGRGHRAHSHPNNILSGVYYAKTQPGADTVNFHDPRPQTGVLRPPVTALTAENTDQVVMTVTDGTLLLFPAWLEHSVDANHSSEERISVSFNVMFQSYAESMSKPLW